MTATFLAGNTQVDRLVSEPMAADSVNALGTTRSTFSLLETSDSKSPQADPNFLRHLFSTVRCPVGKRGICDSTDCVGVLHFDYHCLRHMGRTVTDTNAHYFANSPAVG